MAKRDAFGRNVEVEDLRVLADLDGRTFTTAQLLGPAGVSADELTNYLSKNKFTLASETAGAGRARQFCLIDVYQIALLSRLTSMTRRPEWGARALEQLFFSIPLGGLPKHPCFHDGLDSAANDPDLAARVASYREECCKSARNSLPLYSHRDQERPWFLFISPDDIKSKNPVLDLMNLGSPDESGRGFGAWSGMYINTTAMLRMVDRHLHAEVHGGGMAKRIERERNRTLL